MKFQYIFSIIFWSLYAVTPTSIVWFTIEHPHVLDDLKMIGIWNYYWIIVFILCTSLGIYKTVERSLLLKNHLTTKNQ